MSRLTKTAILHIIRDIIQNDLGKQVFITNNTRLENTGVDSLDALNLFFHIEEKFDIKFTDDFIPETIGQLVDEVERLNGHTLTKSTTNATDGSASKD